MKHPEFDIKKARFEGNLQDGRLVVITEEKYIWVLNDKMVLEFEGYVPEIKEKKEHKTFIAVVENTKIFGKNATIKKGDKVEVKAFEKNGKKLIKVTIPKNEHFYLNVTPEDARASLKILHQK